MDLSNEDASLSCKNVSNFGVNSEVGESDDLDKSSKFYDSIDVASSPSVPSNLSQKREKHQ